jgi:predicted DNA-binding transcriptional regulator AlpA
VIAYVGHKRSWIYREMAQQRFVQGVKCGRSTVWDSALIEAWVAEKLAGQSSAEG